jgi:hypothetical protein
VVFVLISRTVENSWSIQAGNYLIRKRKTKRCQENLIEDRVQHLLRFLVYVLAVVGRGHLNFIQPHKSGQISIIVCKMLAQVAKKRQCDCAIVAIVVFQSNFLVRHLEWDLIIIMMTLLWVDVAKSKPILKKSSIGSEGVIDGRYKFEHGSWSLHNSPTKCNQQLFYQCFCDSNARDWGSSNHWLEYSCCFDTNTKSETRIGFLFLFFCLDRI